MSDWPLEFGRPWLLLLAPPVLWWTFRVARRSIAGQPRGWSRFSLALRTVLLLLLILALADFRLMRKGEGLTILHLLDVSASIPGEVTERKLGEIVRRSRGGGRKDRVGLIAFGRDAGVERRPSRAFRSAEILSVIDREGTDIAIALRLADATFTSSRAEGGRRVILISDGNATHGDALLEARNLALTGAVVDVLPIDYTYEREVLVDALLVPPEVRPEEPFVVEAILTSTQDTRAQVQLYENDKLIESREVDLPRGKTRVEFPLVRAASQRFAYELRVFPEVETDTLTRNNRGHAFALVRGESRVLLVGDAEEQRPLVDALLGSGIACEVREPGQLPPRSDAYFVYDTVLLADVPAYELGLDNMRLLHGVVKNLGTGFVMIGGPDSFGAGGYRGTPVEKLLPVEMDVKQRKMIPNGALVIILHTSEFRDGSGNMWAKRIAQTAVEALSAQDFVGILANLVTGGPGWAVPFGPASNKSGIIAQIRQIQPMDMQAFDPTMALGLQALQGAPAVQKHMIIISDGDPIAPTRGVMQSFVDSRISISTVCIHPHNAGDTATLKKIAQDTGGKYYFVKDPATLPQIFMREALRVRRNLINEETFYPRVTIETEPIQGLVGDGLPPLHGYVITTPKTLAAVPLVSAEPHLDPVLAHWRYGLARTAAFTPDAHGRWARDWLGWPGYEPFWAQLIRYVARRGAGEIFRVERVVSADRGRVTLDAIDPDGRFIDGLEITGRVLDPQFKEESIQFQQTGPGRYESEFSARRSGTYLLSLEYTDGAQIQGNSQTGLTVSYSAEYRQLTSNLAALTELAEATGGRVLGPEDDFFDRDVPVRRQRITLWPELVTALLLLFFLDIFFRRVVVTLAPVRRLLALLSARWRRPAPERSPVLGQLLDRRAEVKAKQVRRSLEVAEAPSAGDAPGREIAEPAEGPAAAAEPEPEAETSSFTDRLLRAKRQARQDLDSAEESKDPEGS